MPEAASPRLLLVAHGTASARGLDDTRRLAAAVAAARPDLDVDLAYLDVAEPTLAQRITAPGATIVVPALLSTGYHVESDIPAAIAAENARRGATEVIAAAHFGADPLVVDALQDRLDATVRDSSPASVALVAAGSSRPGAALEVADAALLLAGRLSREIATLSVGADLAAQLAALPQPVAVATYLLADGRFMTAIRAAVGAGLVSEPLADHPALAELVLQRYAAAGGTS